MVLIRDALIIGA